MKNDLGFVFLDLKQIPEHNMIIKIIKNIIDTNPFNQICIFNDTSTRTDYLNVPVLPLSHCKFFDGDLFLFDILSLVFTHDFPAIKKRYFYCSNHVWSPSNDYSTWERIFDHKNLKIITNNHDLSNIYKICWNIETKVIDNLSHKEIVDAVQQSG